MKLLHILYIYQLKSAEVHIIHYGKPRTRVAQNPKPISDISNINQTAFLFQFSKFITHNFTSTLVYLNTLYQLQNVDSKQYGGDAELHCLTWGVPIRIYTLDSKNPNFSQYLPLNHGDSVFKEIMTIKSSNRPICNSHTPLHQKKY